MSYWRDNHGNIYGPFSKQDDGFPNAGEVVRLYREKMKLSQTRLAVLLGVNRLWIIKMENQNKVPELLSRRRLLAEILQIPPVLLGISTLGSDTFLELIEPRAPSRPSIAPYSLQEANEYLDAVWELHRFTGSSDVLSGVRRQKARIEEQVSSGGREQRANMDLLHRYECFLLEVGRNQQNYTGTDPIGLIDLARQINDPDALAISLYRRGKMYFQQKNYSAALRDIREALEYGEEAGPQVSGLVLVTSGPVLAHHATDSADVREVLSLLDEAEKCIDPAKNYPDPFHARFDESQYLLSRASSIISLLRIDPTLLDEAFEALDTAQERTQPQFIRRRAHIELLYADAAFYTGDYTSAASVALSALELAQSIDLLWNIKDIQDLYEKLAQTKIKDSAELRELRRALLKK